MIANAAQNNQSPVPDRPVLPLPEVRFAELAGSGHVTYAERPGEFADAVAAFATEVTSQERSEATIA
jgi:pimeloyl-ACP methyl ester carboxylesterase